LSKETEASSAKLDELDIRDDPPDFYAMNNAARF